MRRTLIAATLSVLCVWCPSGVDAGELKSDSVRSPEELVTQIYGEVSKTGDSAPDWAAVRSRFHPQAVIVLRASRDETRLMTVDEFIEDFVAFYDRIGPETGFTETVISTSTMVYGNVANCSVVYEAAVGGSERPPQRGLDIWQLMFREGRWSVISVVNESEVAAGPIPESVYRD